MSIIDELFEREREASERDWLRRAAIDRWPTRDVPDCTVGLDGFSINAAGETHRGPRPDPFLAALAKPFAVVRVEPPPTGKQWGAGVKVPDKYRKPVLGYLRCVVRRHVRRRLARAVWAEMGRLGL